MKKKIISIIIILFVTFMVTGCIFIPKKVENNNQIKEEDTNSIETEEIEVYSDSNIVKIGIYDDGTLVTNTYENFINGQDVVVYNTYFTNDTYINYIGPKYTFANYYNESNRHVKQGFYVSFYVGDELREATITSPSQTFDLAPQIYNYLYDGYHQEDGAWYSHLESWNESEPVCTAIKLCIAEKVEEITSPITLMAFTYDSEDDFDSDGHYRGNSYHTVTINRAN